MRRWRAQCWDALSKAWSAAAAAEIAFGSRDSPTTLSKSPPGGFVFEDGGGGRLLEVEAAGGTAAAAAVPSELQMRAKLLRMRISDSSPASRQPASLSGRPPLPSGGVAALPGGRGRSRASADTLRASAGSGQPAVASNALGRQGGRGGAPVGRQGRGAPPGGADAPCEAEGGQCGLGRASDALAPPRMVGAVQLLGGALRQSVVPLAPGQAAAAVSTAAAADTAAAVATAAAAAPRAAPLRLGALAGAPAGAAPIAV